MTLGELKDEIQKYQYFEDTDIIDISLAAVIATRLKIGDPIWLVLIGPSSGGKSQILRPLALTDENFIHRVDDLTENTFLSASKTKSGNVSLLQRIGSLGMIVVSDLTVLFSKTSEVRATILSQFRMVYDGEMVKMAGNQVKPITWKGYVGIVAGSTPSIYGHFEEVADMGERFIYYRMKPYSPEKATRLSMKRKLYGKALDDKLASMYGEYIKEVVLLEKKRREETIGGKKWNEEPGEEPKKWENGGETGRGSEGLSDEVDERILKVAMFAEKVRTVAHSDRFEKVIDRIPVPAMPMRVALQLTSIAKALVLMRRSEGKGLGEGDMRMIDWCGYSLANEEKRACLGVLGRVEFDVSVSTQMIADKIGLDTTVIKVILQNMSATGVLVRTGGNGLSWRIKDKEDWELVRRIENIKDVDKYVDRDITAEEEGDMNLSLQEVYGSGKGQDGF